MKGFFLTTSVPTEQTAATKARADVRLILQKCGYSFIELPKLSHFEGLRQLWKSLCEMDHMQHRHIAIEYPFRARYRLYVIYLITRIKRLRLFGIIHDIGALRKKTIPVRDMTILRLFDGLVSHNPSMSEWLRRNNFNKKIVELQLFDYLSKDHPVFCESADLDKLKIIYAGNLGPDKAAFLYNEHLKIPGTVQLDIYGPYIKKEKINDPGITYKGTFDPSRPFVSGKYHFGLVWEGTSPDNCEGLLGEYLRFNNPHKLSLYISLGLPVIVWKEAAIAKFVLGNGIGVVIEKLGDLLHLHRQLKKAEFNQFVANVSFFREKVRQGYFLRTALETLSGTS